MEVIEPSSSSKWRLLDEQEEDLWEEELWEKEPLDDTKEHQEEVVEEPPLPDAAEGCGIETEVDMEAKWEIDDLISELVMQQKAGGGGSAIHGLEG